MKYITRTVWILSCISFFTDVSSEMLYPVMPVYLESIGFSVLLIGILEGIAEATAGLSKGYFGKLSDLSGRRVPFVRWGYLLSALAKPMLAIFTQPIWIFFSRAADRFGKGLRTGARDAILSDEATPATKGKVFGFHRSMDTFGAVTGPLLALLFLYYYPQQYKTLFFISFIPAVLSVLTTLFLKDTRVKTTKTLKRESFFNFLLYWRVSPPAYRKLIVGLLIFALFNSSDMFLLLKLKQSGMSDTYVIGAYIFYNLIYALFAFPIGFLADRLGLKRIFIFGLLLFTIVYFGMAVSSNINTFIFLFFLYGIYAAATEGISKAWVSNVTDPKDTATAIGMLAGFQSICAMLASSLAGLIWYSFGAQAAFIATSSITGLVILYFLIVFRKPNSNVPIDTN